MSEPTLEVTEQIDTTLEPQPAEDHIEDFILLEADPACNPTEPLEKLEDLEQQVDSESVLEEHYEQIDTRSEQEPASSFFDEHQLAMLSHSPRLEKEGE